jgi:hypothetical protein
MRKEQQKERISIFMAFSVKSGHLDRYIKEFSLTREDMLDHLKASVYTQEELDLAKQKNVSVLHPLNNQKTN